MKHDEDEPIERSGELRAFPTGEPIIPTKTTAEFLAGAWGELSKLSKLASSITAIIGLLAIPVAAVLWIVSTVDDARAETVTEIEKVREHTKEVVKERPLHTGAVPRELYEKHVERFERESKRSENRDRTIEKKIDVLGVELTRSERAWRRRLAAEGLNLEGEIELPSAGP